MSERRGLQSMGHLLGPTLARLGIDDLPMMLALIDEWEQLAGPAWAARGTPLIVRRGTLVVEAESAAAVRLLRYGEQDLLQSLQARFGPNSVTAIEVVPPRR